MQGRPFCSLDESNSPDIVENYPRVAFYIFLSSFLDFVSFLLVVLVVVPLRVTLLPLLWILAQLLLLFGLRGVSGMIWARTLRLSARTPWAFMRAGGVLARVRLPSWTEKIVYNPPS